MNRRIISILLLINLITFSVACASHSLFPNNRVSEETKSVKNIERKRLKFERVNNILSYEIEAISSQIEDVVKRSARTAENTTDKYDTLVKEYEKKRKETVELSSRIKDMEERLFRAEDFTKELRKLNKPLEKFDDEIFIRLVDHLEVESNDNIKIVWRGKV